MIVVVCPGQGSQTPGFFTPWLELAEFKASIETQQAASGVDLLSHGTTSDADTIRDTAIAQPLIVSAGVASLAALLQGKSLAEAGIAGVAGHSVGEVTAAVAAGIFDVETGIRFVNERGQAMAKAAALEPTSMAAVIGGELAEVESRLAEQGLYAANYNVAGQIVAAGNAGAIANLIANPISGTRVMPLQVAGAFHTSYMSPAVGSLLAYSQSVTISDPEVRIWTNAGGAEISSGAEFIQLVVNQVQSPVRWDLCMAAMVEAGVTAVIEVSPAGALAGMVKRGMPGVEVVALKSPDNLDAARTLIGNHSK